MLLFRKNLSLLAVAALFLILVPCTSVNADDKPLSAGSPKDEVLRTELAKELSFLNIAIELSADELADSVNRMTPKELYQGATRPKGLSAEILRNGPIAVSAADDYIHLTVPVTMSLRSSIFEIPAIATELKFKLSATVTPDWQIVATVVYAGLSDPLAEEAMIGPFAIKPRSIIERHVQSLQRLLSDLASRKLNEKIQLKAQVAKVWNAVQQPVLLDRGYDAWLLVTPRDVLLYPLQARNNQIKLPVGFVTFAELVVGQTPPARPPAPLPDLKPASGPERMFRVSLHTELFYRDIVRIVAPQLLDKEIGSGGKSVILKGLDLYGDGDRLIIKMETAGSFDGIIHLSCKPVFNPHTNLFAVADVDFDMQTQSILVQSADWLLHSSIRNTIQEMLNVDLTARLEQAREMAAKMLARVRLAESVFLVGSVKTIRLNGVMVQPEKISIRAYTEGETALVFH